MGLFWDLYIEAIKEKNFFLSNNIVKIHDFFFEKQREYVLKYKPNFIIPKTMNEKIIWLLHHGDLKLKEKLTDKIEVKNWVAERIGEEYITKTYAVCDSLEEIDWKNIPDSFVIKASHGCRMNIFIMNKEEFLQYVLEKAKRVTQSWINIDYSIFCGEVQYKNIPHKIMLEELNIEDSLKMRNDYSFHCINGKPSFIEHNKVFNKKLIGFTYDLDGKQLDFVISSKYHKSDFLYPKTFDKMIEFAEILSKDFRYVRVDFRAVYDKLFFGEMTFTPFAGVIPFSDKMVDYEYGKKIIL